MLVSEITIPKKIYKGVTSTHPAIHTQTYELTKMNRKLKELGWILIDFGAFSYVYRNPSKNYVLKINNLPDPAYDKFVKFCQKVNSPYLPKIIDKQTFDADGKEYNLYYIEKLYKLSVSSSRSIREVIDANIRDMPNWQVKHFRSYDLFQKYPGLLEMILRLGNLKSYGYFDLHPNNIMMRKDGTPVLIDPFAS